MTKRERRPWSGRSALGLEESVVDTCWQTGRALICVIILVGYAVQGPALAEEPHRLAASEGRTGVPVAGPTGAAADQPGAAEERMLVVIDPGHGGRELGCKGVAGTREKDLVLQVALRLRRILLELPDVQVLMTRAKDQHVGLWERVELANQSGAHLFISIHANAFVRPSLGGVETFFHSVEASDEEARRVARAENAPGRLDTGAPPDAISSILADMQRAETLRDSSRFAHLVQGELAGVLPFENLGVKQADFVVLRGTHMPAVLLELGFLTNGREEKILKNERIQERIAQAVRLAVINYRHLMLRKRVVPTGANGEEVSHP